MNNCLMHTLIFLYENGILEDFNFANKRNFKNFRRQLLEYNLNDKEIYQLINWFHKFIQEIKSNTFSSDDNFDNEYNITNRFFTKSEQKKITLSGIELLKYSSSTCKITAFQMEIIISYLILFKDSYIDYCVIEFLISFAILINDVNMIESNINNSHKSFFNNTNNNNNLIKEVFS